MNPRNPGSTFHHTRTIIEKHFKPALVKAKIPGAVRLYDLRHTCASLLLAAGTNPKVVAEKLGHASVQITLDTYSHTIPSTQITASEDLEKVLFG